MKVASLLPSATEIVCALGMRDALVGVSHECDWPRDVVGLPVLTSARVRQQSDSAAIDRDVRQIVRDSLAVYDVDTERLGQLRPDVIVTQDLCDVCAVSLEDVQRAVSELTCADVTIANTHPTTLAGIWSDIRRVARALDRDAAATELLAAMDQRVESVRRRTAGLDRPSVLAIEWLQPVMIGGMWSPELIDLAGGRPLLAATGTRAPTLGEAQLRVMDPVDVVLVKPCGFDIDRTLTEEPLLRTVLSWLPGDALAGGRVFIADGNAYFNRPGPRIVDSLEMLAACLHPDEFGDLAERHRAFFAPLSPDPRP